MNKWVLWYDIKRTFDLTHGSCRLRRVFFCLRVPGVQAVIVYRFGNWLLAKRNILRQVLGPIYWILNFAIRVLWGIDINRNAQIGQGFYIGHFGGITISGKSIIGTNCNISQNVTIGVSGKGENRGVPVIGDNVYVGPGARIFGKITIGSNVKIGANAVIYRSIPDNAVAVLDPGFKIIPYQRSEVHVEIEE